MNTATYELSEDLLRLAGYTVSEDVDQPGLWVWTREENGRVVGGCDSSFDSAQAAWDEVREMVSEVLADEAQLSASEWNILSGEERDLVIHEQFK